MKPLRLWLPLLLVGLLAWLPRLLAAELAPPESGTPHATLSDFRWTVSPAELLFHIDFTGNPRLSVHDELVGRRMFYCDFYGIEPPREAAASSAAGIDTRLDSALIHNVKRIYYPRQRVLRFVFYTRGEIRFSASVAGGSKYRVRVTPILPERLGGRNSVPAAVGKSGVRKRVIIDPGHGGAPGAQLNSLGAETTKPIGGRIIYEKELTLQIARRLETLMRKSPNLEPVLTRGDDSYVALQRRIEIANEQQGDLFLSIHLNATDSRDKDARGFEVFYLSDSNKATSKLLLALENDEHLPKNQGTSSDESLREILRGLADDSLKQRQAESADLAVLVDQEFRRAGPFRAWHRGVKSAAFRVLMNYGMPAVLVECGFIDNPSEANELVKADVQQRIAGLLFNGINRYFATEDPEFRPYLVDIKAH